MTQPIALLTPSGVTFGDQVQLVGYGLQRDRFQPGQVAEVVLAWRPTEVLASRPSFTLRLVDGEGRQVAQVDRALAIDAVPGEVRFERLALPLHPALVAGRYVVTLGSYTVIDAGFETLPSDGGETVVSLADLELAPLSRPPFTLHGYEAPFDGGPTLVGTDYDRSVPGVLRVYLHWRGPGDVAQVRVRAASGLESGALIPPLSASSYQTVIVDLPEPVDGPMWLRLVDDYGAPTRAAGPWGWPVREIRLPGPEADARFVPLGDEMVVVGAKFHALDSGQVAVDVTLMAQRPLTSDDATSVRLMDSEGRWLATDDCQPALGAIPTLKWIRSSRVVDRHLLHIPDGFTGGEVRGTLVAYERFRMTPIPSMDGRFGEVPLGTWTGP